MEFTDYDTRLAAYALIVEQREGRDQVLLALWNEPEQLKWTLPGGGVELAESPELGAVREVREESGYDVELTGLLGIHTYVIPPERRLSQSITGRPRALKAVRVVYTARIVGGELTREIDGTTDEARWIPIEDVAALPQVSLVGIGLDLWRAAVVSRAHACQCVEVRG